MIKRLLSFVAAFSMFLTAWAQPSSNPLADFYGTGEGYPSWSDAINWGRVINMSTYTNGATNFNKFENARDELFAQGGGVLYYPAGEYEFDVPDGPAGRGLMLKSGVVIRGEIPADNDRRAVTTLDRNQLIQHGLISNPTKFKFTRKNYLDSLENVIGPDEHKGLVPKMWNVIGCTPANAEKVGIAWVEVEFGFVYFGFEISESWSQYRENFAYAGVPKGAWASRVGNGTHPLDVFSGTYAWGQADARMGADRFVFGVHLKNSTITNYAMNKSGLSSWKIEHGGWQFGPRLGVYGRHIFIANNCISKPTACFVFDQEGKAGNGAAQGVYGQIFDYANCLGVDVNKNLLSGIRSRCSASDSNGFYANDIIVKENWVYNHGNKNFEIAGKYVVIKDNVAFKEGIYLNNVYGAPNLTSLIHKSSYRAHRNTNTEDFMNRGFDYGGWNVWFHNNRYEGTGSLGNDGEGILCQRHGGVEAFSITMTANEQGPTGMNGYLAPYDVTVAGLLHGWNFQRGSVGVLKVEQNFIADVSVVKNFHTNGNASGTSGQTGARVNDYLVVSCPGQPSPGTPAITLTNEGRGVKIAWNDVSDEVGYAVQRRRTGTNDWTTVAFRPRQASGSLVTFAMGTTGNNIGTTSNYGPQPLSQCWDGIERNMNEPSWLDYTRLSGTFDYRVVALACEINGSDGTASNIDTIVVTSVKQGFASKAITFLPVVIMPNPAEGSSQITVSYQSVEPASLRVFDMFGKLVKEQAPRISKSGIQNMSTKGLAPGNYLMEVKAGNGISRARFIIQ